MPYKSELCNIKSEYIKSVENYPEHFSWVQNWCNPCWLLWLFWLWLFSSGLTFVFFQHHSYEKWKYTYNWTGLARFVREKRRKKCVMTNACQMKLRTYAVYCMLFQHIQQNKSIFCHSWPINFLLPTNICLQPFSMAFCWASLLRAIEKRKIDKKIRSNINELDEIDGWMGG